MNRSTTTFSLRQPYIVGMDEDVLDPAQAPLVDNVQVYYDDMADQELVTLQWEGPSLPAASYSEAKTVINGRSLMFTVPRPVILAGEGHEVTVWYRVGVAGGPESYRISFEIRGVADDAPTIDRLVDGQGAAIPDGGNTLAANVTLSGTASANQNVQILDNGVTIGQVTTSPAGAWSFGHGALAAGRHSYVARALYGSGLASAARSLARVGPLVVDTSTLNLNGVHVQLDASLAAEWSRTGGYAANVSVRRAASGGLQPYTYRSNNTAVATVDSTGLVTSQRNGSTTTTVSDAMGQTVVYSVSCSNNYTFFCSWPGELYTFAQALNWIAGSPLNHPIPHNSSSLGSAFLQELNRHKSRMSTDSEFHTGTHNPGGTTLTNLVLAQKAASGSFVTEAGPVGVATRARVCCYRSR